MGPYPPSLPPPPGPSTSPMGNLVLPCHSHLRSANPGIQTLLRQTPARAPSGHYPRPRRTAALREFSQWAHRRLFRSRHRLCPGDPPPLPKIGYTPCDAPSRARCALPNLPRSPLAHRCNRRCPSWICNRNNLSSSHRSTIAGEIKCSHLY